MARIIHIALVGTLAGCTFAGNEGSEAPAGPDASLDAAINAAIDAAIDAPDDDFDDDGVPDEVDNCPMVENPSQSNEDGDSFGNACDRCPVIADAVQQPDGDGDGIGDGCDPQAGELNTYVFFDGFDVAIDANEWFGAASWTQDLAAGVLRRDDNSDRVFLARRDIGGNDNIVVVAAMDFDNENEDGLNFRFGGIYSEASDNGTTSQGCWLIREPDDSERFSFVRTIDADPTRFGGISAQVTENQVYVLAHTVIGNNHGCDYSSNGASGGLNVASGANFGGDDVGIVSSFVTSNLHYLYAIRLQ